MLSIKHFRKQSARKRRGATAVEFAFMVPIIFLIFMGAIEITRLNFIRNSAANACYEGARKAVTPGSTVSDAENEAERLLTMLGVGNGANVTVNMAVDSVTVSASIPVSQNSWGLTRFTGSFNVNQSCKLSRESFSADD
jgi:Flp pilus assembly protein TadG